MKISRPSLDSLGVCASTLCMIHCLVFPFLLAALPLLNLTFAEETSFAASKVGDTCDSDCNAESRAGGCPSQDCCPDDASSQLAVGHSAPVPSCCATPVDFWIHFGLFATVAPLGLIAWGAGVRRHGRAGVLLLGMSGIALLAGALLFGTQLLGGRGEQVMTVLGSVCMVSAHLWNRKQCRCCRTIGVGELPEKHSSSAESNQTSTSHGVLS